MAIVKLSADGQQIEVADDIARDEARLKALLTPVYPDAANATFSQSTSADGKLVVTITKRAGTKGLGGAVLAPPSAEEPDPEPQVVQEVIDFLAQEKITSQINPAIRVAWRINWMAATNKFDLSEMVKVQATIDAAIHQGEKEAAAIDRVYKDLIEVDPRPQVKMGNRAILPFGF